MLLAFDLETTGLDPKNDKIIEISMIKFDENTFEIVDEYTTLVNPEQEIPALSSNITHIFDDDVKDAPTWWEIQQKVIDFIWGNVVVGHNVDFDRNFLIENGVHIEYNKKIDTFFLANILNSDISSLNLEILAKYYKIQLQGAHRARNDVLATIELLKNELEYFRSLKNELQEIILFILSLSPDENIVSLWNMLQSGSIKNIDLQVFKKKILRKVWKYKIPNQEENNNVDKLDSLDFFTQRDSLEKRENQLKMAESYKEILDKKEKMIVEAPTGLGKSFAYLVPALYFAKQHDEKVYISTKTKTLQDQLFYKDLSFLKEQLPFDFSYTKVKGKRNYLLLLGYFELLEWEYLNYDEVGVFAKIALWLYRTEFWELDELTFYPQEYKILNYLHGDNPKALSEKNPYLSYEFVYKARKSIEHSDVVIINHSLLFADFESEKPILLKLKHLVVDEAHSIEDAVTDALKKSYTFKSVIDILEKCENIFQTKKIKKIEFLTKKEALLSVLDIFEDIGKNYVDSKVSQDSTYKTTLIKDDFYADIDFSDYNKKLHLTFLDVIDILATKNEYDFSQEIQSLNYLSEVIKNIFTPNTKNHIKIVSYHDIYGCRFEYTLLAPNEYLQTNIWNSLESCLLTSATLTIEESFDYCKKTLGLDNFKTKIFETDFDYSKQSTLFIPNDLWSIKNNSSQILHFLSQFYSIVGGNILTLLTSFTMIKKIYTETNLDLQKQGINLYPQSLAGSKAKLLSQFLDNPDHSILLGTGSFWEWVDIPREDLKYLVIHKFPFSVPTDPIFQARSIFFKDAFREYSIPKAIIMLKQGFWRLIRSKNDKWMVILLDDRIYSTQWWEVFFNAFPKDINKKITSSTSLLEVLRKK